jgi:hypothetical protein
MLLEYGDRALLVNGFLGSVTKISNGWARVIAKVVSL